MKQLFTFFTLLLTFGACKQSAPSESIKKESKKDSSDLAPAKIISDEDKCVSFIDTLPEINALAENIEKNSEGKNHLTIWIAADPSETKIKYYWVKVGEDNGENIATLYNFYVDPKLEEVLYYDVVNDTLVSLEEWRKNN